MGGAKLNKEKNKKFFTEKPMLTPLESTKQFQNRQQISTNFTGLMSPTGQSRLQSAARTKPLPGQPASLLNCAQDSECASRAVRRL
jgi:hypothetical protein